MQFADIERTLATGTVSLSNAGSISLSLLLSSLELSDTKDYEP